MSWWAYHSLLSQWLTRCQLPLGDITPVGGVGTALASGEDMHVEAGCSNAVGASTIIPPLAGISSFACWGGNMYMLVPIISFSGAATLFCILNPEDMEVTEMSEVHEE